MFSLHLSQIHPLLSFLFPTALSEEKKKNTGLWEWLIMGFSMDEVAIGRLKIYREKKEKEEVLLLRAIG